MAVLFCSAKVIISNRKTLLLYGYFLFLHQIRHKDVNIGKYYIGIYRDLCSRNSKQKTIE